MLKKEHHQEAVERFAAAVATLARELINSGGVPHDAVAAGLRIEAGKIEVDGPRSDMAIDERELVDLARKAHEFINALMVSGIPEDTAVVAIVNTLIERVTRTRGAPAAAKWMHGLASLVEIHGAAIEATSNSH